MKYLRVTNTIPPEIINEETKKQHELKSGCYLWKRTLDGEIKLYQHVEDFEDYDVVHVNVCGKDLHLIQEIRERLPKSTSTKIVANLDYAIEETQVVLPVAFSYKKFLRGADHYFATEEYNAGFLELLVSQPVKVMPHPTDVKYIKKNFMTTKRKTRISYIYHLYDDQIDIPYWITKDLDMPVSLVNFQRGKRARWAESLFPVVRPYSTWEEWLQYLADSRMIYEGYIIRSYGRATTEAAALGVPVAGSHLVESVRRCYPDTAADPMDVQSNRKNLIRLRDDLEFYENVANYAYQQSDYYSVENCRERFMEMISE